MPSFQISNQLSNSKTLREVIYANQQENRATDADDTEILYYSNGAPTSSAALTFDGSALALDGDLNVVRNITAGYDGPTGLNKGMKIVTTDPSTVYMDVHTLPGVSNDFDYRIIFGGGETGESGGGAANFEGVQSNFFGTLRTTRPGAGLAPNWYMDYGSTVATVGSNTETVITFTVGLFTLPPTVVATANTPTASTGNQFVHVEEVTASGFKVEYLGTVATGTLINWIAMGL